MMLTEVSERKRFVTVADALEDARKRANEISDPPRRVLDVLYANTRCTSMFRGEWEREVRIATALDKNLTHFGSVPLLRQVGKQIGEAARVAVVQQLTSAPTLVLGYHGGFGFTRRKLFARLFPEAVVIGATGKYAANDGAFALFAAREALLEGGLVLIAPDGRFGKESGTITVLGAQLPVTDGAPFLAYATNCNVAWFALIRTGDGFTLETVAGPRREHGETFADFRERFYRFYADRLEASLTTDPYNLPVSKNWKWTLTAMLEGKVYRVRRASQ